MNRFLYIMPGTFLPLHGVVYSNSDNPHAKTDRASGPPTDCDELVNGFVDYTANIVESPEAEVRHPATTEPAAPPNLHGVPREMALTKRAGPRRTKELQAAPSISSAPPTLTDNAKPVAPTYVDHHGTLTFLVSKARTARLGLYNLETELRESNLNPFEEVEDRGSGDQRSFFTYFLMGEYKEHPRSSINKAVIAIFIRQKAMMLYDIEDEHFLSKVAQTEWQIFDKTSRIEQQHIETSMPPPDTKVRPEKSKTRAKPWITFELIKSGYVKIDLLTVGFFEMMARQEENLRRTHYSVRKAIMGINSDDPGLFDGESARLSLKKLQDKILHNQSTQTAEDK